MQASINAARSQLPSYLPQNPSYRKANPAEAPILILTLTSDVVPKPQIYDLANSILAQKISQIQGVGQCFVGGSSSPSVRIELNPMQLGANGVGLEAVRTALAGANANRPKGAFQDADHRWQINDNDQIFKASDYAPIIAGYNKQTGAPVRVGDLGTVTDSVADIRNAGVSGINTAKGPGQLKDAVLIIVFKIPGANVISTVDSVLAVLGSGANKWGDYKTTPWVMGWQPSYRTEAQIYTAYINAQKPDAKIGMLYQNDDFGKDYPAGVKDILGAKFDSRVKTVSYEVTDATVDSQILELKNWGADVVITAATPKFAAQSIRESLNLAGSRCIS